MLVDHARKRVWLDARDHGDPPGLAVFDIDTGETTQLPEFPDHHAVGLSPDGALLAITRGVEAYGTNKSDLVVLHVPSGEVRLRTRRRLVYDVAFAPDGEHALVDAYNSRPRRYRLGAGLKDRDQDLGPIGVDFRQYPGDQDPLSGRFLAPSANTPGRMLDTDIGTGDTADIRLPVATLVGAVRFSADGRHVFAVTRDDVVTCFARDWSPVWRADLAALPDGPSRLWAGGLFVPPGGSLLAVSAGSTAANNWGTDYVLSADDGRLLRRIEGYQGRGRIKSPYLKSSVLAYGGFELDLADGTIADRSLLGRAK
jgi:hypothetical protein